MPPSGRVRSRALVAVLFLLAAGIGAYLVYNQRMQAALARTQELIALKNDGLAQVENGQLDPAAEAFRQICVLAPEESLGWRNLSVTLLLKLQTLDKAREADAVTALEAEVDRAIGEMFRIDPSSTVAWELRARYHVARGELREALSAFEDANGISPRAYLDAAQADVIEQNPRQFSEKRRQVILEALYADASENLAAITRLMKFYADVRQPLLQQLIADTRSRFAPVSPANEKAVQRFLDIAEQAVLAGDWDTAATQIAFLGNILRSEMAFTNDLNQLQPHLLERLAFAFSDGFFEVHPRPPSTEPAPVPVAFMEVPEAGAVVTAPTALHAADFDLDGLEDLFVAEGTRLSVWIRLLDDNRAPLLDFELALPAEGLRTADLDRDYEQLHEQTDGEQDSVDTDLDVVAFGKAGVRLYRNDRDEAGSRTLTLMPQSEEFDALTDVADVEIADLDHDGDLDLVVVAAGRVTLWSNMGGWKFRDISSGSALPNDEVDVAGVFAVDFNRNVLTDLLLAVPDRPQFFGLGSSLHGRFHTMVFEENAQTMGYAAQILPLDANQDAVWDAVSAGERGTQLTLMQSAGGASITPAGGAALSETPVRGVATWDFDNDGRTDLVAWGAEPVEIFRGLSGARFDLKTGWQNPLPADVSELVVYDADGDGDQEFAVLAAGKLQVWRNDGGNANHWLDVVIRAEELPQTPRERCNMHGVGSLLELKAGTLYQSATVRGTRTHFGLGQASRGDVLRVLWTNGIPHNVIEPQSKKTIFEQQKLGGSCPYLYAWNGTEFRFVTDCLWAAPIGMQFAPGVPAPFREWEYLKIRGDQLQPRDGEYVLQLTEELWEATYYDHVKLLVVDHPADVEIFSNEKVGPAEIAEFKIHSVAERRSPQSATDQRGRDLLSLVMSVDDRYTRPWDAGYSQGLVEEHWVELDLGAWDADRSPVLFLTGWMYPPSTSTRLASAENPSRPPSKPPAIHVRDASGNWIEAVPYMGFPGGKTKTIAVDLQGVFPTADHRMRIATNMEIGWDEIFVAFETDRSEFVLTEAPLRSADLHFRGFSERIPQPHGAPEFFDYSRVSRDPIWPPMAGNLTRFGDVTDIIATPDDRSVVLGAGDEMTVRFDVPPAECPPGWTRDFLLYGVGWDKDADLNTILGQTIEPLPFREMRKYPYEPEQSFPDRPEIRAWLRDDQTRRQPPRPFWTQIRDWSPPAESR